jgi:hypothetical protein
MEDVVTSISFMGIEIGSMKRNKLPNCDSQDTYDQNLRKENK